MTLKIAITGSKGEGKTTCARAIATFLRDLGYHVEFRDEPHAGHLPREELMRMTETAAHFTPPNVEIYSNQEGAEVLSNKELTQRLKALEARLAQQPTRDAKT